MIKKIWQDPVWSKVIATVIITFFSILFGLFGYFSPKAEVNKAQIVNNSEKSEISLITGRWVNSMRVCVPLLEFTQR
jgi:hypothetical protein